MAERTPDRLHLIAGPAPGTAGAAGRLLWPPICKNASTTLLACFTGRKAPERRLAGLAVVRHLSEVGPADVLLVVHRDPLERFVSAVCDKLIARRGAADLWAASHAVLGAQAGQARLEDWVAAMLEPDPGAADVHFRPQALHLFDRPYHHHPDLAELPLWASDVLGPAMAQRLFQRVNARETGSFRLAPGARPTLDDLSAEYLAHGRFPHAEDLVPPDLRARLARVYAADGALRRGWGYGSTL